jgi:hypothetical protein
MKPPVGLLYKPQVKGLVPSEMFTVKSRQKLSKKSFQLFTLFLHP